MNGRFDRSLPVSEDVFSTSVSSNSSSYGIFGALAAFMC